MPFTDYNSWISSYRNFVQRKKKLKHFDKVDVEIYKMNLVVPRPFFRQGCSDRKYSKIYSNLVYVLNYLRFKILFEPKTSPTCIPIHIIIPTTYISLTHIRWYASTYARIEWNLWIDAKKRTELNACNFCATSKKCEISIRHLRMFIRREKRMSTFQMHREVKNT